VYHARPVTRSDRSRPVLALALALPLAAACAHAPAPTPAADPLAASTAATSPERATAPAATGVASPSDAPDALAPLRAEVDALLTAQGEAAWRGWTGDGPLELTAAAAGREKLLDPAALETVEAARRAATGPARRAADQLRAFLVGERLARASARQAQALASARAAATFTWDKRQVPLRRLPALLAAEPEAARRQALAEAHAAAAAKLGPLVTAREVLTPLDLEAEYGLTGGHPYHQEPGLDAWFAWRPLVGWARYRMPVEGLYLVGPGAHPGGGVTGAPAHNAVKEILADRRKLR